MTNPKQQQIEDALAHYALDIVTATGALLAQRAIDLRAKGEIGETVGEMLTRSASELRRQAGEMRAALERTKPAEAAA